jgi:hypothetical protein
VVKRSMPEITRSQRIRWRPMIDTSEPPRARTGPRPKSSSAGRVLYADDEDWKARLARHLGGTLAASVRGPLVIAGVQKPAQ